VERDKFTLYYYYSVVDFKTQNLSKFYRNLEKKAPVAELLEYNKLE